MYTIRTVGNTSLERNKWWCIHLRQKAIITYILLYWRQVIIKIAIPQTIPILNAIATNTSEATVKS